MIEVKNLSKSYGSFTAVDNISFLISKGEVVGFLGPNGAGKTTTLKIVTCYMPPTHGQVRVADFDIFDHSIDVRKRIGYLPESNSLYLEMGVYEYLEYIARLRALPISTIKTRIKRVVDLCGLGDAIQKDIGELSKGFRQRVGLAQAMIHDPEILIMDEPTSGLDPNQIIEIRELIKELGKEKTVMLSTHVLSEVQATCGRVLIINRGRIVADGTKEELQSMVQGKERIYLELKAPQDDAREALARVPGIENISEPSRVNPEHAAFELEVQSDQDIREAIFYWAVERQWAILEMKRETVSLEDIFRKLTIEEAQEDSPLETQPQ